MTAWAEPGSSAAEWLARGVSTGHLIHALTSGLPDAVKVPSGFVRRRLHDKKPPRLPAHTTTVAIGVVSPGPALKTSAGTS
ncbi:hypothetical protein [Streptomyces sp. NPDC051286]|uniref:hypothetical protein n=1 Tax=Streptomyces sp. NPDC051286 TaxID=3365647 RepID=UPI0037B61A61